MDGNFLKFIYLFSGGVGKFGNKSDKSRSMTEMLFVFDVWDLLAASQMICDQTDENKSDRKWTCGALFSSS
jgi:hypothetical protein